MVDRLRAQLMALIEPLVVGSGYELVDIEYVAGRSDALLRIYIDWPGGVAPVGVGDESDENRSFEGIGVEDCERVSREVSEMLDAQDPIPVAYSLEVSSPGVDRILRTPEHFRRFAGERVHAELLWPREGRKRYTGLLTLVAETGFEMNVDGTQVAIRYEELGKARLAPDWSRGPARR